MGYLSDKIDNAVEDLGGEMLRYIKENIIKEVKTEDEINSLMCDLEDINLDKMREELALTIYEIAETASTLYYTDIEVIWLDNSTELQQHIDVVDPTHEQKRMAIFNLIESKLYKDFDKIFNTYCLYEFVTNQLQELEERLDIIYENEQKEVINKELISL